MEDENAHYQGHRLGGSSCSVSRSGGQLSAILKGFLDRTPGFAYRYIEIAKSQGLLER